MVLCGRGNPRRGRALPRLLRCAHRRHPGRRLPRDLHPRGRSLDVDVPLLRDGFLGRRGPRVQHPPVVDDGLGAGPDRRADDLYRAVDGLFVGQADLGHLVGVGRAPHLGADPPVPLPRVHLAAGGHRRPAPRRQGRCPARAGGRDQRADHLFLGAVVEHAAPGCFGEPEVLSHWMYSIGAALTRVRAIILERERHTDWAKGLGRAQP